jgi:hypothetical protein
LRVNALSNSWQLTKRSFAVVEQDKELLLFPLISGLLGIAWFGVWVWPALAVYARADEGPQWTVLEYVMLFILYLGLAVFSTFNKFCITYTSKVRFAGGNATFAESVRFALGRFGQIVVWAAARATVGLLLSLLDKAAERAGEGGKVLLDLVERALGGLWELLTVFVVPAMVYDGVSPFAAFKTSAALFKQTWGERLVKQVGFGWVQGLCIFGVSVLAVSLLFVFNTGPLVAIPIGLWVVGVVVIVLLFDVASAVYDTALYVYATEKREVGFDEEQLGGAFRTA